MCSEPRTSARADSPAPRPVQQVENRYTKTESAVAFGTATGDRAFDIILVEDAALGIEQGGEKGAFAPEDAMDRVTLRLMVISCAAGH